MLKNEVINGLLLFITVMIVSFLIAHRLLNLSESISVIFAIAIGLAVEILYRKKARKP